MKIRFKMLAVLSSVTVSLLLSMSGAKAAPESSSVALWQEHDQASVTKIDHSAWQTILDAYLVAPHASGVNRFDYTAVSKDDEKALLAYIELLEEVDPRDLNKQEQKAYWINFYNAGTVRVILENRPVKSIRDIRPKFFALSVGPWDHPYFSVAGNEISLNDIEHGILRPIWKDPRLHFVLNCASIGCPNLSKLVFTADNAETQLESATETFLVHPRAVELQDNTLKLSSLFDWYASDFGSNQLEILEFISDYAELEKSADELLSLDIKYHYDWALNKP